MLNSFDDNDNEVIEQYFRDRIRLLRQAAENDEKKPEFWDSVLDIGRIEIFRLIMSTGGPTDWFDVFIDPATGEVLRVIWHFRHIDQKRTVKLKGRELNWARAVFEGVLGAVMRSRDIGDD